MTMLLEYKFYEPAFYHTDIPDWGTALLYCQKLGEKAKVLVDLGHHPQGTNIEFIVANLMWYFEKASKKHTCKSYKKTIFEAVWCVATLGRFNKHIPVSTVGRIIFVLWTFIILILFSLLTAQFSVKLMQNNVADSINSFYDLRGKRVGTTAGSTSEIFLSKNKIKTIPYNNTKELFNDVLMENRRKNTLIKIFFNVFLY